MTALQEKEKQLRKYLSSLKKVAIAFSAGVDSTFLLKIAHDELKDNAIAVTVRSRAYPARETTEAVEFCDNEGIVQLIVDIDEMAIEGFAENPKKL